MLFVDNFDSFSFILLDYIKRIEPSFKVVRNNVDPNILNGDFDRLVISPGPMDPRSSGRLFEIIERYIGQIPILGICLGHQALGEIYGAKLKRAKVPMHGKISSVVHHGDQIFSEVSNPFNVVRYHSLILDELPKELSLIAHLESGEIMGFRSIRDEVVGLQFHPEAHLTQGGFKMISNWLLSTGRPH